MFLNYYGLREQPFAVTPDPRYLYWTSEHREALSSLYYGIESGCGFLSLIARPGLGKTTLLYHLLERLRTRARTAFLFQTQCDSREFLRYLLLDLGVPAPGTDLIALHSQLKEILIGDNHRRLVIVIDEAQNLSSAVLETIRLLSNFERPNRKLMQIVLAGQPQLAERLAGQDYSQLLQRVSIRSRLRPLDEIETEEYIACRLRVAGYEGSPLFTSEASTLIAWMSEGIPRNINTICFHALSLGYASGRAKIDLSTVERVSADLNIRAVLDQPSLTSGESRHPRLASWLARWRSGNFAVAAAAAPSRVLGQVRGRLNEIVRKAS